MTDKIYTYKDIAKIFDCHERTIQNHIKEVRQSNPKNPKLNNFMGNKWYCFENDLKEVLGLCSKLKSVKTEDHPTIT
jgi:transposase